MPAAYVATALVVALFIFEAAVIGGIVELKASTVGRFAPWAYEPYLKLVGEHPDSLPRQAPQERDEPEPESTMSGLPGLEGGALGGLSATNAAPIVIEPSEQLQDEPAEAVVVPAVEADDDIPVG
ncbi:hypothetical protein [Pontiella sulfatireligans]|uniref:Uncharacterized protein n=1 Tax=Pontiella sulfatireligans TaxID=2750658 RepID=A0A6C2URM1_9BACT|nr:hypothetical protein [Pontiella sulfatireligans]VGO22980.1 hypothetical protein SCARR_05079 [Pontiella sulfatireligans]